MRAPSKRSFSQLFLFLSTSTLLKKKKKIQHRPPPRPRRHGRLQEAAPEGPVSAGQQAGERRSKCLGCKAASATAPVAVLAFLVDFFLPESCRCRFSRPEKTPAARGRGRGGRGAAPRGRRGGGGGRSSSRRSNNSNNDTRRPRCRFPSLRRCPARPRRQALPLRRTPLLFLLRRRRRRGQEQQQ